MWLHRMQLSVLSLLGRGEVVDRSLGIINDTEIFYLSLMIDRNIFAGAHNDALLLYC